MTSVNHSKYVFYLQQRRSTRNPCLTDTCKCIRLHHLFIAIWVLTSLARSHCQVNWNILTLIFPFLAFYIISKFWMLFNLELLSYKWGNGTVVCIMAVQRRWVRRCDTHNLYWVFRCMTMTPRPDTVDTFRIICHQWRIQGSFAEPLPILVTTLVILETYPVGALDPPLWRINIYHVSTELYIWRYQSFSWRRYFYIFQIVSRTSTLGVIEYFCVVLLYNEMVR